MREGLANCRLTDLMRPFDVHDAGVPTHTSLMGEALALVAALVSAVTGVVAAAVSVAQWRESRMVRSPNGRPPPHESTNSTSAPTSGPRSKPAPPSRPRGVVQGPPRTLRWALALAAVCCLFEAVTQFSYWNQQREGYQGSGLEALTDITVSIAVLASIPGLGLAVYAAAVARNRRRDRDLRLAGLAFLGCLVPWIGFLVIDFINDL
jgi:hypothetical protein